MDLKNDNSKLSLESIQINIVHNLFFVITIIGIPNLVINIFTNQNIKLSYLSFVNLAVYLLVLIEFSLGKRISVKVQSLTCVLSLMTLGILGSITFGIASLAPAHFIMACIVAVIILPKRESIIICISSSLILAISGYLFSSRFLNYRFDFSKYIVASTSWISRTTTVICYLILIVFILGNIKKYLIDSIERLSDKNEELLQIYEEIAASNEELQEHYELVESNRKEIYNLAYYDTLTGLANRELFLNLVNKSIIEIKGKDKKLAIIYIDLDNFKKINDTMGHNAGDRVLKKIAQHIRNTFKSGDIISRLGGDEYGILVKNFENVIELNEKTQKILNAIGQYYTINNVDYFISASIGIAIYPKDGHNFDKLMKNAEIAMYKAKYNGKNQYKFFDDFMKDEIEDKLEFEMNLREAINRNEIIPYYQPMINADTEEIRGYEVLMRWESKLYGMVSPVKFIPILEEIGLIVEFGQWIMLKSCIQNKQWQDKYNRNDIICINISPVQFKQRGFLDKIKEIIKESGLDPKFIEFEITEGILIDDFYNIINILTELQDLGAKIALDDFGTGYSSLSYLRKLPINTLKIDKSFVDDISINLSKKSIIGSIIALAHDMNLEVVAEGVETIEQKTYLMESNCDIFQGYLFEKPQNALSIEQRILR